MPSTRDYVVPSFMVQVHTKLYKHPLFPGLFFYPLDDDDAFDSAPAIFRAADTPGSGSLKGEIFFGRDRSKMSAGVKRLLPQGAHVKGPVIGQVTEFDGGHAPVSRTQAALEPVGFANVPFYEFTYMGVLSRAQFGHMITPYLSLSGNDPGPNHVVDVVGYAGTLAQVGYMSDVLSAPATRATFFDGLSEELVGHMTAAYDEKIAELAASKELLTVPVGVTWSRTSFTQSEPTIVRAGLFVCEPFDSEAAWAYGTEAVSGQSTRIDVDLGAKVWAFPTEENPGVTPGLKVLPFSVDSHEAIAKVVSSIVPESCYGDDGVASKQMFCSKTGMTSGPGAAADFGLAIDRLLASIEDHSSETASKVVSDQTPTIDVMTPADVMKRGNSCAISLGGLTYDGSHRTLGSVHRLADHCRAIYDRARELAS